MPANLTPEYLKADKWYRSATTPEEKIMALEEMLRVIPRHKGTDHMRADLRRKLSKLKDAGSKKGGGTKQVDIFHVPASGAGQVVFIGVPNSGKSTILSALTNAKVTTAAFPFSTTAPVPGMMEYEDIQIQLVDMPPISEDVVMPGQVGTYRHCDLIGIVIDLSQDIGEQFEICLDFLESRKLLAEGYTPAVDDQGNQLGKRAFCVATKADIAKPGAFEQVRRACEQRFECIKIAAEEFEGLEEFASKVFEMLDVIRVYAKPPHEQPDMEDPFTLPAGSTVIDMARAIHRELAEKLKSARIWGTGVHDGQNVQRTHVLHDKDIIELHFS